MDPTELRMKLEALKSAIEQIIDILPLSKETHMLEKVKANLSDDFKFAEMDCD